MAQQTKRIGFTGVSAAFTNSTEALLTETSRRLATKSGTIRWIPREKVLENPEEHIIYDIDKVEALALDIKERGIQTPLGVIPNDDGEYILISGHRRRLANDIAIDRYGYVRGEELPCIVLPPPKPGREFEMIENLILDNLQRDKSDFNRMMEIVQYKLCLEQRKAIGEDIPVVRDVIKARLGVSDSEITRYEKIYNCLNKALMADFRAEKIAATVTYEIARMEDTCQQYINDNWDRMEQPQLSMALLNRLSLNYEAMQKVQLQIEQQLSTTNIIHTLRKEKPEMKSQRPSSLSEGISMLDYAFHEVKESLQAVQPDSIDDKAMKRVLSKIQRQMNALFALQIELTRLGLSVNDEANEDGE